MKARENPFRAERVRSLQFRPHGLGWDELMARLAELNYRAAFIGHEGAGKTTALEQLANKLNEQGWKSEIVYLGPLHRQEIIQKLRRLAAVADSKTIVLIDSAEKIPKLVWGLVTRLYRNAGGLVITAHNAGRLPTLYQCSTSESLLDELLVELVPSPAPALRHEAKVKFNQLSGNIRHVFWQLYDLWPGIQTNGQLAAEPERAIDPVLASREAAH